MFLDTISEKIYYQQYTFLDTESELSEENSEIEKKCCFSFLLVNDCQLFSFLTAPYYMFCTMLTENPVQVSEKNQMKTLII